MNILVTAIGRATSADIVIKTLKAGHHYVIGCDSYPKEWIANALSVDEFIQAPPFTEKEIYISFLKEICRLQEIKYIMPLYDPEIDIICEIQKDLLDQGICACIPEPEVTRLCRDKYLLPEFLKREKICPTIPTCLLAEADEPAFRYPMLAKQRFGKGSEGQIVIDSRIAYNYVKEIARNKEYILQPFMEGSIINVDVVRQSDENVACVARRDLLRQFQGVPSAVEIIADPWLSRQCVKIANSLGIIGAANFEFIETPSELYLMEINPRFSGGVEFSHLAGYNVVSNHLRCFTGDPIDKETKLKIIIIARKFEEYITRDV